MEPIQDNTLKLAKAYTELKKQTQQARAEKSPNLPQLEGELKIARKAHLSEYKRVNGLVIDLRRQPVPTYRF